MNHDLTVSWKPIALPEAREIIAWHYEPPYDFYNVGEDGLAELLDPAQHYAAATDETGRLIGFACFGTSAQVPGGREAGYYTDAALDLGLGMRPALTGQGRGAVFVSAAITFGQHQFQATAFRLSVAAFNQRAIRAYVRAGFTELGHFTATMRRQPVDFLVMQLRLTP